jgi:protein-tyrosine phosphatase
MHIEKRNCFAIALAFLIAVSGTPFCDSPVTAAEQSTHERALPLEGVQNFRDVGGYRSTDGRTVKWGVIYRSGALNKMTPKDIETLQRIGIKTECDFRSTEERSREPITWPETLKPTVFTEDYGSDLGSLSALLRDPAITVDQARKVFTDLYAELPYKFAGQYRRMFAELLAEHAPLIFNCTAGKDRTGVAAALLLTALGVPRQNVIDDFMLSNQYFDPRKMVGADPRPDSPWRKMRPEVLKVILGVDPAYLNVAFDSIEHRSGNLEIYFEKEMGLSLVQIAKLKNLYLK